MSRSNRLKSRLERQGGRGNRCLEGTEDGKLTKSQLFTNEFIMEHSLATILLYLLLFF